MSDKTEIRLVLEAVDPATECVVSDEIISVASADELSSVLEVEPENADPRQIYDLNDMEYEAIKKNLKLSLDRRGCGVRLRPWLPIDALSYKVHTNRELALMLSNAKPLAAFCAEYQDKAESDFIPESLFEPYVQAGRFIKRECLGKYSSSNSAGSNRKLRRVFYALPGQEWRIDAYLLLYATAEKCGWSEGFERLEGSLLGYEEWQNDEYIRVIYRRK